MKTIVLILTLCFGSIASAQCPGGVCPLPNKTYSQPVIAPSFQYVQQPSYTPQQVYRDNIQYYWQSSNRHWTHPSTIQNHIASTHGVSTAGMTGEQLLTLHDQIHRGERPSRLVSRPVSRTVPLNVSPPVTTRAVVVQWRIVDSYPCR